MKDRIEYYDFLRGIAIVGVIGIHAFWAYQDRLAVSGMELWDINIFIRQLIGCCVPVFLALSGFFLARRDLSAPSKYFGFLRKHVSRVYIPCLIFSLPFLAGGLMRYAGCDNAFVDVCMNRWLTCRQGGIVGNVLYYLVCGEAVYYFVAVIIQFYVLMPLVQRLADMKGRGIFIAFLLSLLSTLVLEYVAYIMEVNLALIIYGGLFPFWTLFYVIGAYYGRGGRFGISWQLLAVAAFLLVFLLCRETYWLIEEHGAHIGTAMGNRKLGWILYCTVCVVMMFEAAPHYRSNAFTRFMAVAGEYSFGIYLIHLFFLLFVVKPLLPGLHWIAETVLSLLLSMAVIWACRRISLPFSKKYLGF